MRTVAQFDRIGEENAFAVLARAGALAAGGMDVINLGIGQPDVPTPEHIVEAGVKALPGAYLSRTATPGAGSGDPGARYLRAALVDTPENVRRGLTAIREVLGAQA